jgi:hypothetical protein
MPNFSINIESTPIKGNKTPLQNKGGRKDKRRNKKQKK